MSMDQLLRPEMLLAALLVLGPMLFAAIAPERFAREVRGIPRVGRILLPGLLCLPYFLVAKAYGQLRWEWFALYALLPMAVAWLMEEASRADAKRRGNWRDYALLVALALAVDLRWLEPAWPGHLAVFGKMLLLDAGIYGFLGVRQLDGVGFDLRLRKTDAGIGMREFLFYALIAIPLGLGLGFLHAHAVWPNPLHAFAGFVFTFLCIALPEELFFRGWLQNLLERRIGRTGALLLTAVLFGLAHWNKRTSFINWRYVLLAAIAGVFYGRAWRAERRVGASALTHATVDTLWSLWLR